MDIWAEMILCNRLLVTPRLNLPSLKFQVSKSKHDIFFHYCPVNANICHFFPTDPLFVIIRGRTIEHMFTNLISIKWNGLKYYFAFILLRITNGETYLMITENLKLKNDKFPKLLDSINAALLQLLDFSFYSNCFFCLHFFLSFLYTEVYFINFSNENLCGTCLLSALVGHP